MAIIIVVMAAAVIAAPILIHVDVPTVTAVMKKSHVIMVAATTIPLVKMMTN
jgi:hypothetical protein